MPGPVVTLLTDFGLSDTYAAQIKGVILGINPQVTLVDLTHDVRSQNILEGAFLLGTSWRYFPEGTIHLAVVDPGVGTARKALLLQAHGHFFLAPDNGLLSILFPAGEVRGQPFRPIPHSLPAGFQAHVLNNPRYWRHPVSATFHGRDIFAPVAAHLSLGVPAGEFGDPVVEVLGLAIPVPRWRRRELQGHVLHIDRFGNVVTSVPADLAAGAGEHIVVELGGAVVEGPAAAYASHEGLMALAGSHGYLEIALRDGSAALKLGAKVGQEVRVRASHGA